MGLKFVCDDCYYTAIIENEYGIECCPECGSDEFYTWDTEDND